MNFVSMGLFLFGNISKVWNQFRHHDSNNFETFICAKLIIINLIQTSRKHIMVKIHFYVYYSYRFTAVKMLLDNVIY